MKRRGFLALVGALPFLRVVAPKRRPNAGVEFPVYRWDEKARKFETIAIVPIDDFEIRRTGVGQYTYTFKDPLRFPDGCSITLGGPRET